MTMKNIWNKGLTKETDERVMKISKSNKGRKAWNKGKNHSIETKRKISRILKGRVSLFKGKHHTAESRRNMSEAAKGRIISEETRKKISKALKGKPIKNKINYSKPKSEKHRKNIALALKGRKSPWTTKRNLENNPGKKGSNHPNWKGGIQYEPYDKLFNNKFRREIRKRDNQICMLCNTHRERLNRALDVHHIDYDKKLTILENCISLCNSCHSKTNHNRKHWMKFFQDLLTEKYNYNYLEDKWRKR